MNTLIQERHNHRKNCIIVKVSRRAQRNEIHLVTEGSFLAIFSKDLGKSFRSNVCNDFGTVLWEKRPHEPIFAYDIVCIHSHKAHTDFFEYNNDGDTAAPLLRCFLFVAKLKIRDFITTGQYMDYQTFSNLEFRPVLKNSFHKIHTDSRHTSGEKILFISVSTTRLGVLLRKASSIFF